MRKEFLLVMLIYQVICKNTEIMAKTAKFLSEIEGEGKKNVNQNYTLRVLSYNLANFNDHLNWHSRKYKIAQEILDIDPDIIGVQELRIDTKLNNEIAISDLAQLIPRFYQYQWIPIMYYQNDDRRVLAEGIGIFSRHRIIETKVRFLSTNEDDNNKRACIRALVEYDDRLTFEYFNTHLTYGFDGQLQQAFEIVSFMNETRSLNYPQILSGDTNFDIKNHTLPYNFLTGNLTLNNTRSNLVDTWTHLYKNQTGYTFSSWDPQERIDMIFYRYTNNSKYRIYPKEMQIFGNVKFEENMSSDHLGVYADFDLVPRT